MTAVDAHVHVIVPELLRDVGRAPDWRPSAAVHEFVDLDRILAVQAQAGIERVVLCPWVGLLFYDVEPDEGRRRCRLANQALGRLRALQPERVCVLGAVPLQDPALAAAELLELMAGGQFAGVEVAASVGGAYLGDPRFEPFWAAAAQAGAVVFVHPTTHGFTDSVFDEYYLHNLVGNPMETTLTAAHMVLGGVMERHPELKVLLAHGGGAILALRGRLRRGHQAVGAARVALTEPPEESIGRFHFDTVTHDSALLRALVDTVGADRVLLGSDYPFNMADPDPVQTVRAAGLSHDEESAVLAGNAERLLGAG
jgi:aminocarboxymuconate-semialdehyde decarboxylase